MVEAQLLLYRNIFVWSENAKMQIYSSKEKMTLALIISTQQTIKLLKSTKKALGK